MRFLIIDDHPLLRHGASRHIAERWPEARVLEAGSMAEGEALLAAETLDCLVLDLTLDDATGLDGLTRLRRLAPRLPILVLSAHSEEAYAARALRLGASGYLNKKCDGGELVQALEQVLAGRVYVTAHLATRLAVLLSGSRKGMLPHEQLSAQEFRVLLQLGAGQGVSAIAEAMHLSAKTVSTYRTRVLEKLQLVNNADLTRYCLAQGLIKL